MVIKVNSSGQARIKFRINVTPDELISIAHQLREIAKFAEKGETAEMDVVTGAKIITFEYNPVKTGTVATAVSSDDPIRGFVEQDTTLMVN